MRGTSFAYNFLSHPAGIRRCVYRGRNRCAEVQQLAEREFVLLGEGFDMATSSTWEPAAEEVWRRYYAKYPEVRLSNGLYLRAHYWWG